MLIVGIGNPYRGDDAVGPEVARRLLAAPISSIGGVISADIGNLIERWQGYELVILVDATQSGEPSGTIVCFDARRQRIPHVFSRSVSSHGFGISEAMELAEALDALPERLLVYGVEGESFETGTRMSRAVAVAIPVVVERIRSDVQRIVQPASMPS